MGGEVGERGESRENEGKGCRGKDTLNQKRSRGMLGQQRKVTTSKSCEYSMARQGIDGGALRHWKKCL